MPRFIFIPVLCLLFTNSSPKKQFCECDYQGAFLKVAPATNFVALIKVTKYLTFKDIYGEKTPMSMDVEIIETYKGSDDRKTVTVWGDPGNLCRPYLSHFKEGAYYVIAFYPAGRGANEKATDYSISICGAYWLNADNEKQIASGDINSGKLSEIQTMDLSQLKSELLKN
jgi:hypothetical protein